MGVSAVVFLPLEEFTQRVRLGDGNLMLVDMLTMLEEEPEERIVVDVLCEVLHANGSFREPIVLLSGAHGGEVIGDGRHRTAAHIRTGVGPVQVGLGYGDQDSDQVLICVTYEIEGADRYGMPLRSLPVGDRWATADICSTLGVAGNVEVVSYSYWAAGIEPQELARAGVLRAQALGLKATVIDSVLESPWE